MLKRSLFYSLGLMALGVSLSADTVIHLNEEKLTKVEGKVNLENNEFVNITSADGKNIKLKARDVLSVMRSGFPEPLIIAHRDSLLAVNKKELRDSAIAALTKVSKNKDVHPWAREYAIRYKVDLYHTIGDINNMVGAVDELAGSFPASRQVLAYRKKIAYLAIVYGDQSKLAAAKTQIIDTEGSLGNVMALYFNGAFQIKKGKYKDGIRILVNAIKMQLPKIKNEDGNLSAEAEDLTSNMYERLGYASLKFGKRDDAVMQLKKIKLMIKQPDSRTSSLHDYLEAEIDYADGKLREAYFAFTKLATQNPDQKDIQARSLTSAIEITNKLNMKKTQKDLEETCKSFLPNFKIKK